MIFIKRNFSKITTVFVLCVFSALSTAAQTTGNTVELNIDGLKVIVKNRPGTPTVAAGLFVRGGVRNLTPKTAGIETLMLDTATAASKNFPREQMRRELSRMGSSIGSGGNYDFSVISMAATRPNFERTWKIFTDVVTNPSFTADDLKLARERTLTGLKNQSASPDNNLAVIEEKLVFANHPYSVPTAGTVETISKFSPADLAAYHKKIMQRSQLLLVIVGDIDAAALSPEISSAFGKLPLGNYLEKPLPKLQFAKPNLLIETRQLPTNYVKGVFPVPSVGDADYSAMRVAMTILQSRVYSEVRIKRNLSYAPTAEMYDFGVNTGNIYVTSTDANQSISLMLREIEDMRTNPVAPEEFVGVPGYFLTSYYTKLETNASQAAEIAKYELLGGGWKNSQNFLSKIRAVTAADVQRVSQKYMKNLQFVVVGDPKAIDRKVFLGN